MEVTLNGQRNLVIKSLQKNHSEIAALNADIKQRIAAHKAKIAELRALQKELKQTKIQGSWLLSLLIRQLK